MSHKNHTDVRIWRLGCQIGYENKQVTEAFSATSAPFEAEEKHECDYGQIEPLFLVEYAVLRYMIMRRRWHVYYPPMASLGMGLCVMTAMRSGARVS